MHQGDVAADARPAAHGSESSGSRQRRRPCISLSAAVCWPTHTGVAHASPCPAHISDACAAHASARLPPSVSQLTQVPPMHQPALLTSLMHAPPMHQLFCRALSANSHRCRPMHHPAPLTSLMHAPPMHQPALLTSMMHAPPMHQLVSRRLLANSRRCRRCISRPCSPL